MHSGYTLLRIKPAMATRKISAASAAAARPASKSKTSPPASGGLGPKLRMARERSGTTVRGMARAVGVSPSLVSQIERGLVMPSVGTLYAITNQLGLMVDDVFKEDPSPAGAAARPSPNGEARPEAVTAPAGPVQRHDTRRRIRLASGVRWELLTAAPDPELEFLYVVYDVGAESCAEDSMMQHGGKEYAYLLSGRLGVKIGFEEFEIGPGDSISFDAQMPHRLFAIGDQPAVAVWAVLNRQGDRRTRRPEAAVQRGPRGKS
jgi:transcriptional regulator with XRE-family HTH domain